MQQIQIPSGTTVPIDCGANGSSVTNAGPSGVYYRDESPVDATTYDGQLAANASITLTGTQFVYAPSSASLLVVASSPAGAATTTETVNTVAASGSAVTLPDVTVATMHDVTLTAASVAFTFPTLTAGKSFTLRLTQDATGGRTATWPAGTKWAGGAAPILSTGAGKQDVLTFFSISGAAWSGGVVGLDIR